MEAVREISFSSRSLINSGGRLTRYGFTGQVCISQHIIKICDLLTAHLAECFSAKNTVLFWWVDEEREVEEKSSSDV